MEQKQNHGGKRSNAGRKPSGINKKSMTVYFDEKSIEKYGGIKEFRKLIYQNMDQVLSNDTAKIIICIAIGILACFADNLF